MTEVMDVAAQKYGEIWTDDYQRAIVRDESLLALKLYYASENFNAMAQDLIDIDLPTTHPTRIQLMTLIRAFLEGALALYRNFGTTDIVLLAERFRRIHSRLSELAVRLCMLELDFDTPLPEATPPTGAPQQSTYWKIPNAQPMELLVSAILQGLPDTATMGDLANKLNATKTCELQHRRDDAPHTDCGLPVVLFVCMADRLVSCSGDSWGGFSAFNKDARGRRALRFEQTELRNAIQITCVQAKNRFEYARKWLSGIDDHFAGRADRCTLDPKRYNRFCESMYTAAGNPDGPWPTTNHNIPGGVPLDGTFGFNHTSESGRSFFGKGSQIFVPMSRCWKCRFVYHYKVYRPGTQQPAPDGVPFEDPRQTAWICNDAFVCAEDLCHYRCWVKNSGIKTGTESGQLIFKPFPNA